VCVCACVRVCKWSYVYTYVCIYVQPGLPVSLIPTLTPRYILMYSEYACVCVYVYMHIHINVYECDFLFLSG